MRLRALATDGSTVLIAGGGRAGWDARWEPQRFNSVFRIAASGPVLHYDKQVAVPFAEYWPAPTGLQPVVFQTEGIESGRTTGIFDAGTCRLGVLICFEAEHAALARVAAHAGANVLIVASNDAVLPSRAIAYEVAQAQLRAIETGLAVVRAANRGVSLLIDPMGRIRQRGDQHVLRHDVPPPQPAIATHVAPWFLALCWSACAFAFQRCG
jgi:apolipoprotein N-acyltransferase